MHLHEPPGEWRAAANHVSWCAVFFSPIGHMRVKWILPLLLCAVATACRDENGGSAVPVDTLDASYVAGSLTESLAPVRAASAAEAEFAELATQRATREPVRQYAQVITADHRAVVSALDSLARARTLTYEASAAVRDVENGVRAAHAGLQTIPAEEFDLAFIRAEVESHRQLVDRLDRELIPSARGDDIRALLGDVRAMSDAHLTRARQILTELLGSIAPATPPPGTVRRPRPDSAARPRRDTLTSVRPDPALAQNLSWR